MIHEFGDYRKSVNISFKWISIWKRYERNINEVDRAGKVSKPQTALNNIGTRCRYACQVKRRLRYVTQNRPSKLLLEKCS